MEQTGHLFLKSLGKKRLRPGGKIATEWLLTKADIKSTDRVLEVACNMGTTMIDVSKRYNCQITGVDLDRVAVSEANENIKREKLENANAIVGNAFKLPFEDNTFDVVINEAMLTMLPLANKHKALKEYNRVLKSGGRIITHDISTELHNTNAELAKNIKVPANALSVQEWKDIYVDNGFKVMDTKQGKMTLMSIRGMIYDEGISGAFKIFRNSRKAKNKKQFNRMFNYFRKNKEHLNYIATYAIKEEE